MTEYPATDSAFQQEESHEDPILNQSNSLERRKHLERKFARKQVLRITRNKLCSITSGPRSPTIGHGDAATIEPSAPHGHQSRTSKKGWSVELPSYVWGRGRVAPPHSQGRGGLHRVPHRARAGVGPHALANTPRPYFAASVRHVISRSPQSGCRLIHIREFFGNLKRPPRGYLLG